MVEQAHCKCIRKDTNKKQYLYLRNEDRNKKFCNNRLSVNPELFSVCNVQLVTPEHH